MRYDLERRLSRPSTPVFIISVVLAVLALIGMLVPGVPLISGNVLVLLAIAYVVLLVGVLVRGA